MLWLRERAPSGSPRERGERGSARADVPLPEETRDHGPLRCGDDVPPPEEARDHGPLRCGDDVTG